MMSLPILSPSVSLLKEAQRAKSDKEWLAFKKKFRGQLDKSQAGRILDLLAALSHQTNISLGCYCEDEYRCHRSVLRELLLSLGAEVR